MVDKTSPRTVTVSLPKEIIEKAAAQLGIRNLKRIPTDLTLVALPPSDQVKTAVLSDIAHIVVVH